MYSEMSSSTLDSEQYFSITSVSITLSKISAVSIQLDVETVTEVFHPTSFFRMLTREKYMKNLVVIMLSVLCSLSSAADEWRHLHGSPGTQVLTARMSLATNVTRFQTVESGVTNPNGCLTDHYAVIDNPEAALSILLTALVSSKHIGFVVDGDECGPNGRVLVKDIVVR
jgi:hypothetical protein